MQSSLLQFALLHGFLRNFAACLPTNQNPIRLIHELLERAAEKKVA
jgi:hypothetical protein